jgi:cytochrome c oxidase subunit 4
MEHDEDIQKHVRVYLIVFGALAVLTGVTVLAYYIHAPIKVAVAIALFIASIKASLVACYFMHLISERKLIYGVLAVTAAFCVVMMGLIMSAHHDQQGRDMQVARPAAEEGGHVP